MSDDLTSAQAAAAIGVAIGTMKTWRHRGKGPPFHGDSGVRGTIYYKREDVEAFIASRKENDLG